MGTVTEWAGLSCERVQPTDVDALYNFFFRDLFNSASHVIIIDGLPENADINFVMTHLLTVGRIATVKINGKIYMTNGRLGGDKDVNYYGTKVIGANPILGSYELERGVDGEVTFLTPFDHIPLFSTDKYGNRGGIYSLIAYTAALLADNVCSLNSAQINGRVQAIITSEDSTIASSAEAVLRDLYAGKPYKVITEDLYKRVHVNPLSASVQAHQLIELIEVQQYIRAMFWNSIGIDSNYNMKRERLISAEVESNFTALKVPISTMLSTLNDGFERTNKCLGTNLKARLNPEYKEVKPVVKLQKGDDNNGNSSDGNTSNNATS